MAAATMYVPASMRSGMIAWSKGASSPVGADDVDDVGAGAVDLARPSC